VPRHDAARPEPRGWEHALTQRVGVHVGAYRTARGMKAVELAARCRELGHPLGRMVIANLENGRRESISIAEVLVLSEALGAAPSALITGLGLDAEVRILPHETVSAADAHRWLSLLGMAHGRRLRAAGQRGGRLPLPGPLEQDPTSQVAALAAAERMLDGVQDRAGWPPPAQ